MKCLKCVIWALVIQCGLMAPPGLLQAQVAEPPRPTASPTEAQPQTPPPGHSLHGAVFDEGPRQFARLIPGQGHVTFHVTTQSRDAKAFIDQGVAQLHSFYYLEAERSFRQAARLDPGCAMAYWGMAMANANVFTPNLKRIQGFIAEAEKRQAAATPRERAYIKTMADTFRDGLDDKARRKAFLSGLEAIVQENPEDLDARAWMAMAAWLAADQALGSRQSVDIVLETVLAKNPDHPGAHHYRIHLWDGVKPERALASARRYAPAADGIAHAWHMPGHTYNELKRYSDAAYQQEGSARVDHAAMRRDRIMPFEIHNYAHNNQWLATSLAHIGRVHDAITVARNLVEQPRDPKYNGPNDGGSPQRNGRARWAEILARYELWDDLITAAETGSLDWSDIPFEQTERAYMLGLAHAAKGDLKKLQEQLLTLRKQSAEATPAPALPPPGSTTPPAAPPASSAPPPAPNSSNQAAANTNPTQAPPPPAPPRQKPEAEIAELEGYEKLLQNDVAGAFERFAKASRMRPEALARAHLKARNFGLAEAAARKAVDSNPDQLPPLACLVETLAACDQTAQAQDAFAKLAPLALHADRDLPIMQRLATLAKSWQESGWIMPEPIAPVRPEAPDRIDLASIGPLAWEPYAAEPVTLPDTQGNTWNLADSRGKNVILLFFLGGKCAHCLQQLQEFGKQYEAFLAQGDVLVAISTDTLEASRELKANADDIQFPMPILSDPALDVFKKYRVFDDFEDLPLHGAFLIDAQGRVRFQRISADPFLDVDFLKAESARVHRLLKLTTTSSVTQSRP
jgi:peroxiredoxin